MIRLPQLSPLTRKRWLQFRKNRRAWWSFVLLNALFALGLAAPLICPYGPREVLKAAAFEPYRHTTLTLTPDAASGRLNLTAEGRITRAENCAAFFPGSPNPNGEIFTNHWHLPPALATALAARFANQAAPALETTLVHITNANQQAICVLAAYEPREAPPASVRIALRAVTTCPNLKFDVTAGAAAREDARPPVSERR